MASWKARKQYQIRTTISAQEYGVVIPINAPLIGQEEIDAVVDVMKTGHLTHGLGAGPMVTEFERAFATFVNAKHAVAVNTGTSALHLSIAAAEAKAGDEVILPSFTFVATAEVVVIAGAKPVFVDIDAETYNVSRRDVEGAITEKTKIMMPVDLYGLPVDMRPIKELAEKHGLRIVEDACQAHGAHYMGQPVGAFSDVACWSFYASKNMTTGEGGMITTNDYGLAEKMRFMRSHGEKEKYKSVMLGHNYHMPEVQAAIGLIQLKKLPTFLDKRRKNSERLSERLREVDSLDLPREPRGHRHSWYLYTARCRNADKNRRDEIIEGLKERGIGSEAYYANPIHLMPYYRRFGRNKLPETEKAANQVFSLPVHPSVTSEEIDFIGESVLQITK